MDKFEEALKLAQQAVAAERRENAAPAEPRR